VEIDETVTLPTAADTPALTLAMTVPNGHMANWYRRILGVQSGARSFRDDSSLNGVTSQFYQTLADQQRVSLGLIPNFTELTIEPPNSLNGFRLQLKGTVSFMRVHVTQDIPSDQWHVFIGPNATAALARYVTLNLFSVRMLLNSFPDGRSYDFVSTTRIVMPSGGTLLNEREV